jgi:pilus assembly protein FimV
VREFKLKKWVAAGLVIAMPYSGIADAAGLGRLNVLSQLGQPFAAEIDLVNVSKEELATLKASLASPAAYQAANLTFNSSLNALRLSIERRPNGAPYIKATSFRPVAEPFLDLLIELTWQGGKIVREYSALLDPPGMESPAPAVTAPVADASSAQSAPPSRPPVAVETPAPATPVPVAKPAPPPSPTASAVPGSRYTVRQGDTLNGIATGVKPEGVSLEQTLIGLFRANPDAFTGNNINQLRAGKILNVPEREQLAAIAQSEAAQEVRVQASNWNTYRQKVADAAPATPDSTPAAKGKITARVEDKAGPAGPKDVVVLSKGDTGQGSAGKGKDGKATVDRVRALEEDLAARDKALAESRERVAQLEKTLQDMRKVAELKNPALAAAQQQAAKVPDPKADAKVPAKPEAKAEPPKAEPPKAEPPKSELPKAAEPPKVEASASDAPKVPPPPPKVVPPAPKKSVAPEPTFMDTVMDNIVPIGGGAAALLVGIGGIWALRRRKKDAAEDDEPLATRFKTEPFRGNADADAGFAAQEVADPTVSNVSDVVDPIDEAQVYIDHGRDAQAEDILKEARGKNPNRADIPLKLLEVYAARGDKNAFNSVAQDFHKLTGGVGDQWNRAAAMGHALDPSNALYPSTGEVVDLSSHHDSSAGSIDLDIGGSADDPMSTTTDILLDEGDAEADAGMNKTMVISRGDTKTTAPEAAPGGLPDFNIELPPASAPAAPVAPASTNMLEFNIDLPPASEPATAKAAPAAAAKPDDGGLDFKVDFSGINLNLDEKPGTAAPAGASSGTKDAHWEDVQQKFDLARAYQEMGDKEGAMEILHEVEREGDDAQKAEAKEMLQSFK